MKRIQIPENEFDRYPFKQAIMEKKKMRELSTNLKPCKCGYAENKVKKSFVTQRYFVMCEKCGVMLGQPSDTVEEAAKSWNRRADDI